MTDIATRLQQAINGFEDHGSHHSLESAKLLLEVQFAIQDYTEATGFLRRMFKQLAPECERQRTLVGLATQIDNYIAGLRLPNNRACFAHPEADRMDGCVECVANDIKASRLRAEKAEAEVRRLKTASYQLQELRLQQKEDFDRAERAEAEVRHLKSTSREADWQEKVASLKHENELKARRIAFLEADVSWRSDGNCAGASELVEAQAQAARLSQEKGEVEAECVRSGIAWRSCQEKLAAAEAQLKAYHDEKAELLARAYQFDEQPHLLFSHISAMAQGEPSVPQRGEIERLAADVSRLSEADELKGRQLREAIRQRDALMGQRGIGHWTQAELDERVRLARENA